MNAIIHAKLLLTDHIIWDGALTWEGDSITQVGRMEDVSIPEGTEIIDAKGLYLAPGLIDIHNHGCFGDLFGDAPESCCRHFLAHGQTTVLPTYYSSLTAEYMLDRTEKLRSYGKSGAGRILGGLYMEGPYMNGNGSNQREIKWQGEILREEYAPLLEGIADYARIWAVDPGRPGIEGFMADVKKANPDAIFAMGHSNAAASDCRRVQKYGLRVRTHQCDGGKAPGFAQGCIGAGCDEYTLYMPDLYAELICDQIGIHVDPDMIRTVVRTKGVERVILITDAGADKWPEMKNNEADGVAYGPDLRYDYEGHLAGSKMTLENACRNLMAHTGCGICQAIRMATSNPAELLGIDDKYGFLEPGKIANMILIDDVVNVKSVWLFGEHAAEDGNPLI